MKKCIRAMVLAIVLMLGLAMGDLAPVYAAEDNITVEVTLSTTDGAGNYQKLRDALAQASEETKLTVKIINGSGKTYPVDGYGLVIRSNTTVDMGNATLKSVGETMKHNFFNNGDMNGEHRSADAGYELPGGYGLSHDIVLKNGTIDGNSANTNPINLVTFGHATDITVSNVNFKYCVGNHLLEFSGCKDVVVKNCTFDGYIPGESEGGADDDATNEEDTYIAKEAIELDIPSSKYPWVGSYDGDDTVCQNVTITGCTFKDFPCGVGDHHSVSGKHSSNITISDNEFLYKGEEISGCAIRTYAFDNCTIENNVIDGNYYMGIRVYGGNTTIVKNNTIKDVIAKGISVSNSIAQGTTVYEKATDVSIINNTITSDSIGIHPFHESEITKLSGNSVTTQGNPLVEGEKEVLGASVLLNDGITVAEIKGNTIKAMNGFALSASNCTITLMDDNNVTTEAGAALYIAKDGNITTLTNNDVKGTDYGVQLSESNVTTVTGNTIESSAGTALFIVNDGAITTLKSNTITGKENGIQLSDSKITTVALNTINATNVYAITVTSGGTISKLGGSSANKNTITCTNKTAVSVSGSGSKISDMSYNVLTASNTKEGMGISLTSKGAISKCYANDITAGSHGIRLASKGKITQLGSTSTKKGNEITSTKGFAISIADASITKIQGNTLKSTTKTALFMNDEANVDLVENNTITGKENGIQISNATIKTLAGNTIKATTAYGITVTGKAVISKIGGSSDDKNTIQCTKKTAVSVSGSGSKIGEMSYNVLKATNSKDGMGISLTSKGAISKCFKNTITAGSHGIRLASKGKITQLGATSTKKGNKITSSNGFAISVADASISKLLGNSLTSKKKTALFMTDGAKVTTMTNNTVAGKANGIQISDATIGTMTGNTITAEDAYAITVTDGAVITTIGGSGAGKNIMECTEKIAISVTGAKSEIGEISYNEINAPNSKEGYGVSVRQQGKIGKLYANTITAGNVGVRVDSKGVVSVVGNSSSKKGNKITAGKWGVYVKDKGSKATKILGNTITSKTDKGIFLTTGASATDILSNTITASKGSGIYLNTVTVKNIKKNNIKNAKVYSIAVTGKSKVTAITDNTLSKKSQKGLFIVKTSTVKTEKKNKTK